MTLQPGFSDSTLSETVMDLPPGVMADLICYSSGLETEQRIHVLETADIGERLKTVTALLKVRNELTRQEIAARPDFPPDFSVN